MFTFLISSIASSISLLNHVSTRIKHTGECTVTSLPAQLLAVVECIPPSAEKYKFSLHCIILSICSPLLLFTYTGAHGVMWWSMRVTYYELCSVLCAYYALCDMSTSQPGQGKPCHCSPHSFGGTTLKKKLSNLQSTSNCSPAPHKEPTLEIW